MKIRFLLKESFRTLAVKVLYKDTMDYIRGTLSETHYTDSIYEILTKDHAWQDQKSKMKEEDWKIFHQYTDQYNSFIKRLSKIAQKTVDSSGKSTWQQSVSSWFYLLKIEQKPRAKIQKKLYITVSKKREHFSHNIEALLKFFTLLDSANLVGRKHFKLPVLYQNFMNVVDNLVIYCDEDEDLPILEDIVKQSGIISVDRSTLDRTAKGVDGPYGSGQSDTQLIAEEFVRYINAQRVNILNTKKSPEEVAVLLAKILSKMSLNASHR